MMNARKVIETMVIAMLVASAVRAGLDDPVHFADANLKQAVKDALGITTDPTEAQMATLTELTADNKEIADLTGMKYATNLKYLYLDDNQIADINPIAGLANLERLKLSRNQISGLPDLSALVNLRLLQLNGNQIVDLNALSLLTNIRSLELHDNQITDISPLASLTTLVVLEVHRNQISIIPDLSGLTNLKHFGANENQISDISGVSNITSLEGMKLSENQISSIPDLSGLTNLKNLAFSDNQITDISGLAGLVNLEDLGLSRNFHISDIGPLSGLTTLTHLTLYLNEIVDIAPLSSLTRLEKLYLDRNPIADISPLSTLTNLTVLTLHEDQINTIPDLSSLTSLVELTLRWNQLSNISGLSELTSLSVLDLEGTRIDDISVLSGLTNLTYLNLAKNRISDISPLSGLSNLERLELQRNPLDWAAYCEYIPMILASNPGINLTHDENPYPYGCDYEPAPTSEGSGVVVTPEDYTTGTNPVTLTFETIEESGYTSLATSDSGPTPPTGFQLGDPPTYYEITTTAISSGQIAVCISYGGIGFTGPPEALRLYHYDDTVGDWVDCTDSVDTENQIICGIVNSLSTFAIVEDVERPTIINVSASPDTIWPPNHKMVEVTVNVEATDNDPRKPSSYIVGITSNEPTNGPSDGNTDPDWLLFPDETLVVLLRAERDGGGDGRVYTIDVVCEDASGNQTADTVDVIVPHDQGKGKK